MSIETYSLFYYGMEITSSNQNLNFDEGGSELVAVIDPGGYTHTELATAIKTALDAAGALTYTVTFNRADRTYTIAATGSFSLLVSSGTQVGTGPFTLLGFTGADLTGAATYTGNTTAGSAYEPQFKFQSFVSNDDNQEKIDAQVNESATGDVEVISFGTREIMELNIKFATNRDMSASGWVKNNASGVSNLRSFMQFAIKKAPFEIMEDIATKSSYKKVILESTPESQSGTGYKLKELSLSGGPTGFFETGLIRLRVLS